jgi:hypothetical protein
MPSVGHRSTSLRYLEDHCPRALDHYEAGAPYDRDVFQVGVAAHAVIEMVGKHPDRPREDLAQQVAVALCTEGRSFEGEPEGPLRPQHAAAGRDIALRFLAAHDLSPGAMFEHGLAVDREWKPVPYDSAQVYYRAAIDMLEVVEDTDEDGSTTTTIVSTDWKSAWPTSADELDTLQLHGQTALALAHYPEATILRRRAANLRTLAIFEADVFLDDDGLATVGKWRKDIDLLIAVAEHRGEDGRRPARPGASCIGCPFLSRCEAARAWLRGSLIDGSPVALATRLAVADAVRKELWGQVKAVAGEEPIAIPGGEVGFITTRERTPRPELGEMLALAWFGASDPKTWREANHSTDQWVGLLQTLKLGVASAVQVAKLLYPPGKGRDWRPLREALVSQCVVSQPATKFSIAKTNQKDEDHDEG